MTDHSDFVIQTDGVGRVEIKEDRYYSFVLILHYRDPTAVSYHLKFLDWPKDKSQQKFII